MAQQSGASGAGAAVLASLNTQDPSQAYAQHRQRADAQHQVAGQLQTQAEQAAQNAIAREGAASELNRVNRQDAQQQAAANALSTAQQSQTTPASATIQPGTEIENIVQAARTGDPYGTAKTTSVPGTAPSVPGTRDGELSADRQWVWNVGTNEWRKMERTPSDLRTKRIIRVLKRRF